MDSKELSWEKTLYNSVCLIASAVSNVAEYCKTKMREIWKGYSTEKQFYADETEFFLNRSLPTKYFLRKCFGRKWGNGRFTVLLYCSITDEKLTLLVIGNAANPRTFKENEIKIPKNLPLIWRKNTKSRMISNFCEVIRKIKEVLVFFHFFRNSFVFSFTRYAA